MIATYRLQLRPDFGFAEVEALVPYVRTLGASHLYLSPITESRPGSTHGYDVTDHNAVRSDFGGREALEQLLDTAHEAGLKVILDFVPNHAGVGPHNDSWQDVLAYGPHAEYAHYFDIDWTPLKPELQNKILLPFLGQPYGEALDDGEIGLQFEDGRFAATYYDDRFALSPLSYPDLIEHLLPHFERTDPYWNLKDLQDAYANLDPEERAKAETLRSRLASIHEEIDLNAPLDALDTADLHDILEQQYWRLAYWKTASYEINYRRFFDINELVALRMEDERVFWDAHRLLGELFTHDAVDGVRIDHVDGLTDPHTYLDRLHELGAHRIWVEKILAPGETLPEDWPVEGTTGYEFMNDAMGVLLDADGEQPLQRIYRRYVPDASTFDETVYRSKKLIMGTKLSSELFRLAYELDRLSEADYHTRDFTFGGLRVALAEVVAAIDRYRTYLPHETEEAQEVMHEAVHWARQRNPATEPTVYDFIARVVMGDVRDDLEDKQRAWVARFQQYTAPVTAKGVEDTTFYRHLPLVALNEVGGEPEPFGTSLHAFHSRARFRSREYPRTLLATATHDHKRGAETRMRLIALAEVPDRWDEVVQQLTDIGDAYAGEPGPSRRDAYLFFQILAALWHDADRDALPDRLWSYMQKAARESKRRTSWINPNETYEDNLKDFVLGIATDPDTPDAIGDLSATLAQLGFFNSLSQLVLKMTSPGVPDIYRGTELPDLSLVDPDNRRPVDWDQRRSLLEDLEPHLDAPDGDAIKAFIDERQPRAKAYVLARLLRVRNRHEQLFAAEKYQPLHPEGPGADHWIAFARQRDEQALITVVPRFPSTFDADEPATLPLPEQLSSGSYQEMLTGQTIKGSDTLDLTSLPLPWTVLIR